MVLIAIVAAIAALATPAWRNHRITDRLDHAVKASEAAKLVVMETATTRRQKPSDLTYNVQATSSAYTARVDISESRRITIVIRDTGASPDPTFLLAPLDGLGGQNGAPLMWSCDVIAGSAQWIPPSCSRPAAVPVATASAYPASS